LWDRRNNREVDLARVSLTKDWLGFELCERRKPCILKGCNDADVLAGRQGFGERAKRCERQGFEPARDAPKACRGVPVDRPSSQRATEGSEVGWVLGTEFATGC